MEMNQLYLNGVDELKVSIDPDMPSDGMMVLVMVLVEWKSDLNYPEVMKLSVLGPALSRKEETDETDVTIKAKCERCEI